MKIYIINISSSPAHISSLELQQGISFLENNWFEVCTYDLNSRDYNIDTLNQVMSSEGDSIILFSSGWFDAINNMKYITETSKSWKKTLLWFSDTLHIQSKYHNVGNVLNVYGITLRNIFLLTEEQKIVFFKLIYSECFYAKLTEEKMHSSLRIKWRLFGWHIMIFVTTLEAYSISLNSEDILYLEFHDLSEHLIYYYIDVLNMKGILKNISGVIIDQNSNLSINKKSLVDYLYELAEINIYSCENIGFFPLYKTVIIEKWNLTLLN